MGKSLSHKEAAKEKMMDALMEYAALCYLDHIYDSVDAEKDRFYKENSFPSELDARVKKFIRYRLLRERFLKICSNCSKVLPKVAMALIAICVSIGVLAATSEAARVKILNFVIEVENEFTNIRFQHGMEKGEPNDNMSNLDTIPNNWSNVHVPKYIPEGFKIANTETYTSTKIIYYANEQGQQIEFNQYIGETMELMIDTEDAQVEKILINGMEGLVSEKEGITMIVWHNHEYLFYLISEIEREELIKMANSV